MADLPTITQASKIAVAGTYAVEQTSNASFDLVNATYLEHQQAQNGHTNAVAYKKRKPRREESAKCTILPALASIDPLLSTGAKHGQKEDQELQDLAQMAQMVMEGTGSTWRSSRTDSLCQSKRKGRHGLVSQMSQMSDQDAMAWLTRPPTG